MNKFRDLISIDKIRFNELYEIFQYSILYIIITIVWGFYLNRMFPPDDESKSNIVILAEIVLQAITVAISVFYIIKFFQIFTLLIKEYIIKECNK